MNCRNCPYIEKALEKYMLLDEQEEIDEIEKFCHCEKVGGKIALYGICTEESPQPKRDRKKSVSGRKTKRRKRILQKTRYKNHLKSLYENVSGYPSPVYYKTERYIKGQGYVPMEKPYLKRCYRDNHGGGRSVWYKKQASKAVRKYEGYIEKGGTYKKIYEYWYQLF